MVLVVMPVLANGHSLSILVHREDANNFEKNTGERKNVGTSSMLGSWLSDLWRLILWSSPKPLTSCPTVYFLTEIVCETEIGPYEFFLQVTCKTKNVVGLSRRGGGETSRCEGSRDYK